MLNDAGSFIDGARPGKQGINIYRCNDADRWCNQLQLTSNCDSDLPIGNVRRTHFCVFYGKNNTFRYITRRGVSKGDMDACPPVELKISICLWLLGCNFCSKFLSSMRVWRRTTGNSCSKAAKSDDEDEDIPDNSHCCKVTFLTSNQAKSILLHKNVLILY